MMKRFALMMALVLVMSSALTLYAQEPATVSSEGGLTVILPDGFSDSSFSPMSINLTEVETQLEIAIIAGEEASLTGEPYEDIDTLVAQIIELVGTQATIEIVSEPQEGDINGVRVVFTELFETDLQERAVFIAGELEGMPVILSGVVKGDTVSEAQYDLFIDVFASIRFEEVVEMDDAMMGVQRVSDFPPNTVYMADGVQFNYPDNYVIEPTTEEVDDFVALFREGFGVFVTVLQADNADDILQFVVPAFITSSGAEFDPETDVETVTREDDGASISYINGMTDLPESATYGAIYYIVDLGAKGVYGVQAQVLNLEELLDDVDTIQDEIFEIAISITLRPPLEDSPDDADDSATGDADMSDADMSDALNIGCTERADAYDMTIGQTAAFICPAGCSSGSLWGTDIYTTDSSMCRAAIHAGVITADDGGAIIINYLEGQDSYEGSERNGVTSSSWGSWDTSFSVSAPK